MIVLVFSEIIVVFNFYFLRFWGIVTILNILISISIFWCVWGARSWYFLSLCIRLSITVLRRSHTFLKIFNFLTSVISLTILNILIMFWVVTEILISICLPESHIYVFFSNIVSRPVYRGWAGPISESVVIIFVIFLVIIVSFFFVFFLLYIIGASSCIQNPLPHPLHIVRRQN